MTNSIKAANCIRPKAACLALGALLLLGIAGSSQAAFLDSYSFIWRETTDFPQSHGWTVSGTVGVDNPYYGSYYTFDVNDTGFSLQFNNGHSFQDMFPDMNGYTLTIIGTPWLNTGLGINVISSAWASFSNPADFRLTNEGADLRIDFGHER